MRRKKSAWSLEMQILSFLWLCTFVRQTASLCQGRYGRLRGLHRVSRGNQSAGRIKGGSCVCIHIIHIFYTFFPKRSNDFIWIIFRGSSLETKYFETGGNRTSN